MVIERRIQLPIHLVRIRQRARLLQFRELLLQFGDHGFQLVLVARPGAHRVRVQLLLHLYHNVPEYKNNHESAHQIVNTMHGAAQRTDTMHFTQNL